MTVEQIEFFRTVSQPALVFGRGNAFVLLPLGTGEPADPAILLDGVERGFRLAGYLGVCRGCGGVAAIANAEVPDSAATVCLARSRYAGWLSNLDEQVSALHSLYSLQDPRQ